jgi:hypothetical protein
MVNIKKHLSVFYVVITCVPHTFSSENFWKSNIRKGIDKKVEELMTQKGIIVLESMNLYEQEEVIKIISENNNIDWFVIKDSNRLIRMVLRYKEDNKNEVEYFKVLSNSTESYIAGDYETSIRGLKYSLSFAFILTAYTFEKLGFSYLEIGDIDNAITHLTIADSLYIKEERIEKNLSDIITTLEQKRIDIEEKKLISKVGLVLCMMKDGYSFDDACEALKLNHGTVLLTKLYVAREYCISGGFDI